MYLFPFLLFLTTFNLQAVESKNPDHSKEVEYHAKILSHYYETILQHPKLTNCIRILWKQNLATLNTFVNRESPTILLHNFNSSGTILNFNGKYNEHCTLVLYLYLNYFTDKNSNEQIFPENWESRLPGGYLASYHLILHRHCLTEPSIFSPSLPKQLQVLAHRLVILVPEKIPQGIVSIWECNIWGESCRMIITSNWIWKLTQEKLDLEGHSLIWVSVYFPHVNQKTLDKYKSDRKDISLHITPQVEISEGINATAVMKSVKSQNYGTVDKHTGVWSGAAGEVVKGNADVALGMLITQDRYDWLILSKTIDADGLTFVTGPPTPINRSVLFLFKAYDWEIWLCLILTIIVLSILIRIAYGMHFETNSGSSPWQYIILVYVLNPLLEQPMDSKNYNRFLKTRSFVWILGPWLLSLVVLGTLFKTNLISTLTYPVVDGPPQDFKSVIDSDYRINFLGINLTAGVIFNEIKAKGNAIAQKLDNKIDNYYNAVNGAKCVKKTFGKHNACLGIKYMLAQYVNVYMRDKNGQPLFRFGKEFLFTTFYAFGISKSLPHLKDHFDKMMYHFAESGCHLQFVNLLNIRTIKIGKLQARKRIQEGHQFSTEVYRNSHDSGTILTFVVLGMGLAITVVTFVAECFYYWIKLWRLKEINRRKTP